MSEDERFRNAVIYGTSHPEMYMSPREEIKRLCTENEKLRAALKPFADKADHHTQGAYWMDAIFTVDECRAAAAALKETNND